MANSRFPVQIGSANRGNAALARALLTGHIRWIWDGGRFWWYQRIQVVNGSIGATALAGATSQELDLHTAFPDNLFPSNVLRLDGTYQVLATAFSGGAIATMTSQIGDTNDPNGLLTATDIFTGASTDPVSTPAAAENASRPETAFIPTLTLTSTVANLSALTAGDMTIYIPFLPLAS